MAGKKREEVTEKDIAGLKYFDKLAPLLGRLHKDAYQRSKVFSEMPKNVAVLATSDRRINSVAL